MPLKRNKVKIKKISTINKDQYSPLLINKQVPGEYNHKAANLPLKINLTKNIQNKIQSIIFYTI